MRPVTASTLFATILFSAAAANATALEPSASMRLELYDEPGAPEGCDVRTIMNLDLEVMTASLADETVLPCGARVLPSPRTYSLERRGSDTCQTSLFGYSGLNEIQIKLPTGDAACTEPMPAQVEEYFAGFYRTYDVALAPAAPTIEGRYEYAILSPEECEAAHSQGFWGNCVAVLELCPDNRAVWRLTDVPNHGTYQVTGDVIDTRWNSVEAPPEVQFVRATSGDLVESASSRVWTRTGPPRTFCH